MSAVPQAENLSPGSFGYGDVVDDLGYLNDLSGEVVGVLGDDRVRKDFDMTEDIFEVHKQHFLGIVMLFSELQKMFEDGSSIIGVLASLDALAWDGFTFDRAEV